MPPLPLPDRLAGGLWGLLVADALGVPYEFHAASEIPPVHLIEMEPPPGFERAHPGTPPGTWSDDGAQALVLLASLLDNDGLDLPHLATGLAAWLDRGYMAVDGRVFDVGIQTRAALGRIRDGTDPEVTGPADEQTNGNGSLMRVLPLALWHTGPDADLVRDARRQSLPTHGHPRAGLCCALYSLWARRLLSEHPAPWDDAVRALRQLAGPEDAAELGLILGYDGPLGTGYVVSTLHSARRALEAGPYEDVVRASVAMGEDTDTTACVAGGLAGVRDGAGAIPERWWGTLRGKEVAGPWISRLVETRGA